MKCAQLQARPVPAGGGGGGGAARGAQALAGGAGGAAPHLLLLHRQPQDARAHLALLADVWQTTLAKSHYFILH